MTEPVAPGEDADLRMEALELLVELLIGQLRASAPETVDDAEARLRRYLRAEGGRRGSEPPTREWQMARRVLTLLERGHPAAAAELIASIEDPG